MGLEVTKMTFSLQRTVLKCLIFSNEIIFKSPALLQKGSALTSVKNVTKNISQKLAQRMFFVKPLLSSNQAKEFLSFQFY